MKLVLTPGMGIGPEVTARALAPLAGQGAFTLMGSGPAIQAALDDAGIEIPFPYVTHTFKETVPVSQLGDTKQKTP